MFNITPESYFKSAEVIYVTFQRSMMDNKTFGYRAVHNTT